VAPNGQLPLGHRTRHVCSFGNLTLEIEKFVTLSLMWLLCGFNRGERSVNLLQNWIWRLRGFCSISSPASYFVQLFQLAQSDLQLGGAIAEKV
jgi:hypothetical protein